MSTADFRMEAILQAHAHLVPHVVRKEISSEEAAKLAVRHGDALVAAMGLKLAAAPATEVPRKRAEKETKA